MVHRQRLNDTEAKGGAANAAARTTKRRAVELIELAIKRLPAFDVIGIFVLATSDIRILAGAVGSRRLGCRKLLQFSDGLRRRVPLHLGGFFSENLFRRQWPQVSPP